MWNCEACNSELAGHILLCTITRNGKAAELNWEWWVQNWERFNTKIAKGFVLNGEWFNTKTAKGFVLNQ